MIKYKLLEIIPNTFIQIVLDKYVIYVEKVIDNKKWIDTLIIINGKEFKETIKTYWCNFNGGGILNEKLYYIELEGESFVIDLVTNIQSRLMEKEFIGFQGFFEDKILIKNHTIKTKSNWEILGHDFMAMIDIHNGKWFWDNIKLTFEINM